MIWFDYLKKKKIKSSQSQKKLPVPTSKTPPKKRTSERSLYLICCDITRSEPWNPTPTTGDTCDARFDFFLLQIIKSNHILTFLFPKHSISDIKTSQRFFFWGGFWKWVQEVFFDSGINIMYTSYRRQSMNNWGNP
jgi:hypothetical protein